MSNKNFNKDLILRIIIYLCYFIILGFSCNFLFKLSYRCEDN